MRTGEPAAAAGVNAQTLRYYERRGLLAEPRRSLGGHRLYPEQSVTVLRVIKAAQRLGFTLDEVTELLAATRFGRRRADAGLQARATAKLAVSLSRPAQLGLALSAAGVIGLSWSRTRTRRTETSTGCTASGCDCPRHPEPDS
nr:MerR family transcriptional regulator [Nocardia exalbida]